MSDLKSLYRETLRRHAAEPVGFRKSIEATNCCEGHNPLCGDRVDIFLKLNSGMIEDVAFDGEACTICMASASLLCEHLAGQTVQTLEHMKAALRADLEGRDEPDADGPLAPLLGVRPYPSRIQCAMLPWETAAKALEM